MTQLEILHHQIKNNHRTVLYKGEIYTYYDEGLTRMVYVNNDQTKVIKQLIHPDEVNHNKIEYDLYTNSSEKDLMAHTVLSEDGSIVEQEFVLPVKYSDKELTMSEIIFSGRCRDEVGWNSQGKLVCFDISEFKQY